MVSRINSVYSVLNPLLCDIPASDLTACITDEVIDLRSDKKNLELQLDICREQGGGKESRSKSKSNADQGDWHDDESSSTCDEMFLSLMNKRKSQCEAHQMAMMS